MAENGPPKKLVGGHGKLLRTETMFLRSTEGSIFLIEVTTCLTSTAFVTLSLLEVSPRSSHLPFLIISTKIWLQTFPDYMEFWIDHSIGRRVCVLIEKIIKQEPKILDKQPSLKTDLNRLVASLTNLGIPEGYRLEEVINQE